MPRLHMAQRFSGDEGMALLATLATTSVWIERPVRSGPLRATFGGERVYRRLRMRQGELNCPRSTPLEPNT